MAVNLQQAYSGKSVLLTGHTGFKGAWLALWLNELGAHVHGYALQPYTDPSLYTDANVASILKTEALADINHVGYVQQFARQCEPDYVFHLAAQAVVSESYHAPLDTFQTNCIGTVQMLEVCRHNPSVQSAIMVTTDKVYRNDQPGHAFRESDELGGHDPYSASKAAAELAVAAWRKSYPHMSRVSTVRAGNVIGGGDWAKDRIVPDCIRAFQKGELPLVRNPQHVRPWQHVLDPLYGYLVLAARQWTSPDLAGAYNFGPAGYCLTVRELVDQAQVLWGLPSRFGGANQTRPERSFHESPTLALDISKAIAVLDWSPLLGCKQAIEWAVEWYKQQRRDQDMGITHPGTCRASCETQIGGYMRRRAG